MIRFFYAMGRAIIFIKRTCIRAHFSKAFEVLRRRAMVCFFHHKFFHLSARFRNAAKEGKNNFTSRLALENLILRWRTRLKRWKESWLREKCRTLRSRCRWMVFVCWYENSVKLSAAWASRALQPSPMENQENPFSARLTATSNVLHQNGENHLPRDL